MRKFRYKLNGMKEKSTLYLMIAPAVIYFFIFAYLPMAGIVLAFKNFNFRDGIFGSPWCGFDNFRFFFISGQAFLVTKNTVLYNIAFITVNTVVQIMVAILLSQMVGRFFKRVLQSMMILPYFISWVVAGAFIYNIFNYEYGFLNSLLQSLNLEPIDFYGTSSIWKYVLISFNCWKWVGYGSVLYLAAIVGIDVELYEASKVDGSNIFQEILYITLPLLKPTVIILTLLSIGRIVRGDFEMFYQIIGDNGLLYNATDVIDTFVFRSLMNTSEIGMPAAAGFYQSVLCFVFIMITNHIVRKVQSDYALF